MGERMAAVGFPGPSNWLPLALILGIAALFGGYLLVSLVRWVYQEEIARWREQRQRRKCARRG